MDVHSHLKVICQSNASKFDSKISNKQFLLGKYFTPKKHNCPKKIKKSKMGKLLEKQLQYTDPEKQHEYDLYIPLNKLWLSYINSLLQEQPNRQSRELKLLRSDFHGANIEILSSKVETYIGITGIVIGESLRTFKVVCQGGKRVKNILKNVCVFVVRVNEHSAYIVNGNNLVLRPSDRIKHKFKFKKSEALNHKLLSILNEKEQENDESI